MHTLVMVHELERVVNDQQYRVPDVLGGEVALLRQSIGEADVEFYGQGVAVGLSAEGAKAYGKLGGEYRW